jgi:hypothetical protein
MTSSNDSAAQRALPELPEPSAQAIQSGAAQEVVLVQAKKRIGDSALLYTFDQMRAYALAAIEAATAPSAERESQGAGDAVSVIRGTMEFIRLHAKPGGFDPALAERRVNARLDEIVAALAAAPKDAATQGKGETLLGYTLSDIHEAYSRGRADERGSAEPVARVVRRWPHYNLGVELISERPVKEGDQLYLRSDSAQARDAALEELACKVEGNPDRYYAAAAIRELKGKL